MEFCNGLCQPFPLRTDHWVDTPHKTWQYTSLQYNLTRDIWTTIILHAYQRLNAIDSAEYKSMIRSVMRNRHWVDTPHKTHHCNKNKYSTPIIKIAKARAEYKSMIVLSVMRNRQAFTNQWTFNHLQWELIIAGTPCMSALQYSTLNVVHQNKLQCSTREGIAM